MNIFLTGATGFIGKNLLLMALKKGHKVIALSRKKQNFKHKNLKWTYGLITKNLNNELRMSDIIIHLASEGVNNKRISYKAAKQFNVISSMKLFQNALRNNCKKWIIAGSASEYGASCFSEKKISIYTKPRPQTSYEKTKFIFSKKILSLSKNKKAKCRLMRIFPVFGAGENKKRLFPSAIHAAKNGKNFYVNNGDQIRDFTSVDFVSKVILDACNINKKKYTSTQIWHISSCKPQSVKNFTKKIWRRHKAKGKLIFNDIKKKNYHNYISEKKSVWVI